MQFQAEIASQLEGDVDIEAMIQAVPRSFRIRGLFLRPLCAELGARVSALGPRLEEPPPPGGYRPLSFYPTRDFLRLFDAAARLAYPALGGREAHRRRAHKEIEVFARSILGRATLSVIRSPVAALLRYPESFGMLASGPSAEARQEGPALVRVALHGYEGSVEYPLGVLEGLVMSFGATPRTEVSAPTPGTLVFRIGWAD